MITTFACIAFDGSRVDFERIKTYKGKIDTRSHHGVLVSIFGKSLTSLSLREEAAAALEDGQRQLHVLQRQVVLGKLYPSARSVMENAV